jgi:hypothetical protein
MTATCLINRMPSRILSMKSPCELLMGENKFLVPLKLFGCVCFVRDHRPSVGKLDPHAAKCIFIGYPSRQDSRATNVGVLLNIEPLLARILNSESPNHIMVRRLTSVCF